MMLGQWVIQHQYYFFEERRVIYLKKILREVRIILPIGIVGSILLILCTYIFKGIFCIIEKLSGFFENDGFFLIILGVFTIAFAIKWVSSPTDNQKD